MSIHNLPPETMLDIFSRVDFLFAMRSLSLVCRSWRALCFDRYLWNSMDFTLGDLGKGLNDTIFKKAIEHCPLVKTINMSRTHITSRGMEIIIRSCKHLENIDLSFCTRLKSAPFDALLNVPRLKSLNLLGTWKITESTLVQLDDFLSRNISLGVSIELFPTHGANGVIFQLDDERMAKLAKLKHIDLHIDHDIALHFLEHRLLPSFSSSLISLEIGSRSTSSAFPYLSRQIGHLTSLTSLAIISHDLTSLPAEFANLTKLKILNISGCKATSFTTLPEEITKLPSLSFLNLSWNRLQRIPPTISRLTSLTKLCFSNNELLELPDEIGQLTQLVRLNASVNKLATLPPSLGRLSHLERLNVAHNVISNLPDSSFANMASITTVDLQSNRLMKIPQSLAKSTLTELFLNDNVLESLPLELTTQAVSLRKLILHHNRLSSLPSSIDGLAKVKFLSLHSNSLEYLPSSIEQLCSLKTLELSSNRLRELPSTVTNLSKLRRIELQNNCFTSLSALRGINSMTSLKSVQFDPYLQEGHPERCMCKFCIFARFDEAHFDDIVEGDAEFEAELISLFFKCTENDFAAMKDALENHNFHEIYFISHKIKGALSNMGAVKLTNLCSLLEEQARMQSIFSCKTVFDTLKMEYGHIKQVLLKRLQRSGHRYIFSENGFK